MLVFLPWFGRQISVTSYIGKLQSLSLLSDFWNKLVIVAQTGSPWSSIVRARIFFSTLLVVFLKVSQFLVMTTYCFIYYIFFKLSLIYYFETNSHSKSGFVSRTCLSIMSARKYFLWGQVLFRTAFNGKVFFPVRKNLLMNFPYTSKIIEPSVRQTIPIYMKAAPNP